MRRDQDIIYHGEVDLVLGLIESLGRMRDVRMFLLGNSVSTDNPYFLYFDLHLPYNSDIITFRNGTILLQNIVNEKYIQAKKSTRFGQMVSGTDYEAYAIDNKFLNDNRDFIEKKKATASFTFSFDYNGETYGVWSDYKLGKMYISSDYKDISMYHFAFTLEDHSPNTMLIKSARNFVIVKRFIDNYKMGNLYFESSKIKVVCSNLIRILLYK